MTGVKVISTWSLAERAMTREMVTKIRVPDIIGIRAVIGKGYIGKFGNTGYTFPVVKWKVEISCEIPETGPPKCLHT